MRRELNTLAARRCDLVIVGGGIYGACAAWDAALRGLSVALIEQGDFGHATSANSQKIIHGGLRYLQSLDLARMRESIRERRTLLRIAPHLVRPLPFLVPTYGWGRHSKPALAAALALNDCVSWDRNQGVTDPQRRISAARIISRDECLRWAPELPPQGLTGGALWHDGQVVDSERLTLAFVRSAAEAGADVANYLRATALLRTGARVEGVRAEDALTGRTLELRARLVLNTCGPWAGSLVASLNGHRPDAPRRFLKAVNLVTRPLLSQPVALGVESRSPNSRVPGLLFITPWQDRSIVGTAYWPHEGSPDACQVTAPEIEAFIQEVNAAFPAARLSRREVQRVHVGLLPAAAHRPSVVAQHYRLLDHQRLQGIEGLISTVGVKYTTARDVAEKTLDLVCAKLGRRAPSGLTRTAPLIGGDIPRMDAVVADTLRERPWGLAAPLLRRLVERHGSGCAEVLKLGRENLIWAEPLDAAQTALKAEVIHAVRHEMALTLGDVVFRRTGLGAAGHPGAEAVRACAELMAPELGWDAARIAREVAEVEATFQRHAGDAA